MTRPEMAKALVGMLIGDLVAAGAIGEVLSRGAASNGVRHPPPTPPARAA